METRFTRGKSAILERSLAKLFSEMVSVWRALFGKDKLEQANDYDKTYYIIEKEPLINAFTSVPKENSTLNCAAFHTAASPLMRPSSPETRHWREGTLLLRKAVVGRPGSQERTGYVHTARKMRWKLSCTS
uniref:Uncharacterized protein n=1 Tax=Oncorhynchus tshawytscha TaxID=74940 RepID=A0A8C8J0X0_ONCTS